MELWVTAATALLVFYSNYMVPPLIPAFSREFAVIPGALGWLVPGFSIWTEPITGKLHPCLVSHLYGNPVTHTGETCC